MEQNSPPPVSFSELVDAVLPEDMMAAVELLLYEKVHAPEKAEIPRVREIDAFIEGSMNHVAQYIAELPDESQRSWDSLNKFFIEEVSA